MRPQRAKMVPKLCQNGGEAVRPDTPAAQRDLPGNATKKFALAAPLQPATERLPSNMVPKRCQNGTKKVRPDTPAAQRGLPGNAAKKFAIAAPSQPATERRPSKRTHAHTTRTPNTHTAKQRRHTIHSTAQTAQHNPKCCPHLNTAAAKEQAPQSLRLLDKVPERTFCWHVAAQQAQRSTPHPAQPQMMSTACWGTAPETAQQTQHSTSQHNPK